MAAVLRKLGPETARFLAASIRYRVDPLTAARRYWTLYRHRRFSPDEIHFLQLLKPALTEADLRSVVSKEELVGVQCRLNPPQARALTENKIRFHLHCLEHGLPAPAIFALYGDSGEPGHGIPQISGQAALAGFLAALAAPAFILKPVTGVNGEGVIRCHRREGSWCNDDGVVLHAADFVERIDASPYRSWMFQEVIEGHPALRELSDTSGLQTVRVVTVVNDDGDVEILAARLRLICGNTAYDNFEYGKTGNAIANLDVHSGEIRSAIAGRGAPPSICSITEHPRTGRPLIGFRVPQWAMARQLVERAAKSFLPLRTIGWDVAITAGEPCLIEGNVTWGALSGEPRMGEFYRYLDRLSRNAGRLE